MPKARKALYEILDKTGLKCCPDCDGQGGKILQPLSVPFNPEEVFCDCKRCNGSGMITKYDALKKSHTKLKKYAQHMPNCELHKTIFQIIMEKIKKPKCTCGFKQALAEAEAIK